MRTKADFGAMHCGKRLDYKSIRLVYRDNQLEYSRLGMAVSKKFGNAVQRNRARRQIREVFRHNTIRSFGIDVLAIPRGGAARATNIVNDFTKALAMIRDRKGFRG